MKSILISLLIVVGFQNIVKAQSIEIKEFQQKKTKIYLSNGIGKSKGLKFSIQYPTSYKTYDIDNVGMVKGFTNNTGTSFMIGLLKHEEALSLEGKKYVLAQENLEKSMRSISSTAQVINYKNNFEVDGYMAACLTFQVNSTKEGNLIIRSYTIEINNYSVIISFILPLSNKLTATQAAIKLNTYEQFFDFVIASFKTTGQKKQDEVEQINTEEYLEYKNKILETDKSKQNEVWINEFYRNTKYKFRISFPKNWEYDGGTSKRTVARAFTREKGITMSVSVTHLEHIKSKDSNNIYSISPITKDQMNQILAFQNMQLDNFTVEKGYLNNFPAYIYEFTSKQSAGTDSYTYVSKQVQCYNGNKIYVLGINLPIENWDADMYIEFDRFVKSFIFEIMF